MLDDYLTGLSEKEQEDLRRMFSEDVLPLMPLVYEQAVASLSPEHQGVLAEAYDEDGAPRNLGRLLENHPDIALELGRHIATILDQPPEYGTNSTRSMLAWQRYERTGERRFLDEAISLSEQIREHPVFETHYELARLAVLNNGAALYLRRYEEDGDLEDVHRALPLLDRAVKQTPDDSPYMPGRLQNRGNARLDLYERLGEVEYLDRSIQDLRLAVVKTPSHSPYLPDYLDSLGNALRQLYARDGDLMVLDEATSAYRRAVDATPEYDPRAARRLNNLGTVFQDRFERTKDKADFDEALRLFERAVDLTAPGSPGLPLFLSNLGGALKTKFLSMQAPADLDRAVETYRRTVGESSQGSPTLPGHLAGLGGSLLTRAEYAGSSRDLEEGIEVLSQASRAFPSTSPHLIMSLNNLARGYSIRYDLTGDAEALRQATKTSERACRMSLESGADPEEGLRCARSWGNWAFRRGAWEEAVHAYGYAERFAERLLRIQLFRAGKESWLGDVQGLADRAAYALAKTGDLAGAAVILERGRARLLTEVLDRDRADLERLGEVVREDLRDRYVAAVGRWTALHDAAVGIAQGRSGSSLSETDLLDGMRAVRAELDEIVDEIRRVPGHELFQKPSSFEEILSVAEQAPLVYLVATFVGSLALVVAEGGVQVVWLPVTAEEIGDLLVETGPEGPPNMFPVVGGYVYGQLFDDSRLGGALAELLPRLGETVVAPVAELLRSLAAREVVLVPDGRLGSVPVHAATYAAADGNGTACLLDEFDVSYAPNTRSLGLARAWAANAPAVPRMAGVGNPLPTRAPSLGWARAELEAVSELFGASARPLYERAATKGALVGAMADATHLHLACHGFFDLGFPPNSGLLLADDEELTLGEILYGGVGIPRARLAVLSACQSAISDFGGLPDEYVGLPTALLQAGVPGVVGTLWPVNDYTTALLMSRFYELHLRGDPASGEGPMRPARALCGAQRWLRRVGARELLDYLDDHPSLDGAVGRSRADGLRGELAALSARGSAGVLDQPLFGDDPVVWAPFVFVGA